jgi:hypothetical protein
VEGKSCPVSSEVTGVISPSSLSSLNVLFRGTLPSSFEEVNRLDDDDSGSLGTSSTSCR